MLSGRTPPQIRGRLSVLLSLADDEKQPQPAIASLRPPSGNLGNRLLFCLYRWMDAIGLSQEPVDSLAVVRIVGAIVRIVRVIGNRSIFRDLLPDPLPITHVTIWQRHSVSFPCERQSGTK